MLLRRVLAVAAHLVILGLALPTFLSTILAFYHDTFSEHGTIDDGETGGVLRRRTADTTEPKETGILEGGVFTTELAWKREEKEEGK